LKSTEKETTLDLFRSGRTNILVATPVVEVGIDIPNATVMVIEGADRFGLAQLHQLRGRVGRGSEESWCLLFTDDRGGEVAARLRALETHHQGEELAELDLKLRGPGELYGLRQSGLPDFKVADLTDLELIAETRRAAGDFLDHHPKFSKHLAARLEPLLQPNVSPD
jgi:ATP-dependent DNA helicase RecG